MTGKFSQAARWRINLLKISDLCSGEEVSSSFFIIKTIFLSQCATFRAKNLAIDDGMIKMLCNRIRLLGHKNQVEMIVIPFVFVPSMESKHQVSCQSHVIGGQDKEPLQLIV